MLKNVTKMRQRKLGSLWKEVLPDKKGKKEKYRN